MPTRRDVRSVVIYFKSNFHVPYVYQLKIISYELRNLRSLYVVIQNLNERKELCGPSGFYFTSMLTTVFSLQKPTCLYQTMEACLTHKI